MFEVPVFVRKCVFFFCKWLILSHFKAIYKGQKNIPQTPSALIVANHSSYLDVFVIGIAFFNNLIDFRWVISKNNYKIWFLKWFWWVFQVIPVNGTVEKIKKALNEKKWVVIFPEGAGKWCSTEEPKNKKLNTGAAVIALSTGITIIPIHICGADKALPPHSFKLNPAQTISVVIGEPFRFEPVCQERLDQALLEKTTQEIMGRIISLQT